MTAKNLLEINFSDIFKSSFLDKITQISAIDYLIAIILSFLIGIFIFIVYKKTFSGVVYSRSFNISLLAINMITTLIILGVTSNIVLSLGMVGALSIVRFRTAIKDPVDLVFLFWAICEGILCGAGLIPLACVGAALVGLLLLVFIKKVPSSVPYLLVVKLSDAKAEKNVSSAVKKSVGNYKVKSKTVFSSESSEIIYELRIKNNDTEFVNKISEINGVASTVLVSGEANYIA